MNHYPYPLSLKYEQLQKEIAEPEKYPNFRFTICTALSSFLRFFGAVMLTEYFRSGADNREINKKIIRRLLRPSEQNFLDIINIICQKIDFDDPLLNQVDKLFEVKKSDFYKGLRELVSFRNDVAHALKDFGLQEQIEKAESILNYYLQFEWIKDWQMVVKTDHGYYDCNQIVPKESDVDYQLDNQFSMQPVLINNKDKSSKPISLWPFLYFSPQKHGKGQVLEWSELFLYNSIEHRNINYIAYRFPGQISQMDAGLDIEGATYRDFIQKINIIKRDSMAEQVIEDYSSFAEYYSKVFIGRDHIFEKLNDFIDTDVRQYAVLRSLAGVGKTAVMANFYLQKALRKSSSIDEDEQGVLQKYLKRSELYVWYFCMQSGDAYNPINYLKSINAQIAGFLKLSKNELNASLSGSQKDLVKSQVKLIQQFSNKYKNKKLIICIDALDEAVIQGGTGLDIPQLILPVKGEEYEEIADFELPENVKYIFSYRVYPEKKSDEDTLVYSNPLLEARLRKIPEEHLLSLTGNDPMMGLLKEDVENLITDVMKKENKPVPTQLVLDKIWQGSVKSYQELVEVMKR